MKTFVASIFLFSIFTLTACANSADRCPTCPMDECDAGSCEPCESGGGGDAFVSKEDISDPDLLEPEDSTDIAEDVSDPDSTGPHPECDDCELVTKCELAELVYLFMYYEGMSLDFEVGEDIPDVPEGMYCHGSVLFLVWNGYMSVNEEGTFGPEQYVSRYEAIETIVRAFEINVFLCPAGQEVFEDIPDHTFNQMAEAEGAALGCLLCGTDLEEMYAAEDEGERGGCFVSETFKGNQFADRGWLLGVLGNMKTYKPDVPCDFLCHPTE